VLVRATETEYVDERRCERRCEGRWALKVGLSYLEENLAALRLDVNASKGSSARQPARRRLAKPIETE
jgi:hypothetical protein